MRIAIIDSFFDDSHAWWASGLQHNSEHEIEIFCNPPKNWKWQMVGGTLKLAAEIGNEIESFDLIVVTDMIDLPSFFGYLKDYHIPKTIIYFHENQITYPWSKSDADINKKRDHHYGFMNLRSVIMADKVVFNSVYHKQSFLSALPQFTNMFPSFPWARYLEQIGQKSLILPIGIDMSLFDGSEKADQYKPIFLWNHRWEYDKKPNEFFETLFDLDILDYDFGLIVLGRSHKRKPEIFEIAKERLNKHILHWGYVDNKENYYALLNQANILLVTGNQDFFGISVVEAIAAGCYPILPLRLSYPEHIEEVNYQQVFYKDKPLDFTRNVIDQKIYLEVSTFQEYIGKYEWKDVAKKYDLLFEEVKEMKNRTDD